MRMPLLAALALTTTLLAAPHAHAQSYPPPLSAPGAPPPVRTPSALGKTPVVAAPRGAPARKTKPRPKAKAEVAAPGAKSGHPVPARPSSAPAIPPKPDGPPAPVVPQPPPPDPNKGTVTGQELPRWASLRSDEVNLRVGPGTNFQIDWVYHRRDLPVKIEREYEVWRQVEDLDGVKGWVHQATLAGRRSFVTKEAERVLRAAPANDAPAVARLKPGVVGRIRACAVNDDWCELQIGDYRGFLRREDFWGTFPGEAVN